MDWADNSVDDDAQESPLKFFKLVVSLQPSNAVGIIGGGASFTCAFITNVPATFTTYQWQIRTDAVTWANLEEAPGYYTGVTTTTLNVLAIDNFLATRTSLDFRCVATNYAGPLPTNSATLTVPIHTTWQPQALAIGVSDTGGAAASIVCPALSAPVVIGFAGPYTYNWQLAGLSAFNCVDNTLAAPTWTFDSAGAPGMFASIWVCVISNGVATVITDPYFIFSFFATAPIAAALTTTPAVISDTGPFAVIPSFVGPWNDTPPGTRWVRMATGASFINFQNSSLAGTTFTYTGPAVPGGAAMRIFPYYAASTPNNSVGQGGVIRYG